MVELGNWRLAGEARGRTNGIPLLHGWSSRAHQWWAAGARPPPPCCTAAKFTPSLTHPPPPPPPAPASTSSPRWVHTFAEIITHRIEPRCREASAALAVNSRFSLWSPEGSCIWILLHRHCAHVSGLCTGRLPEGAHGPIWWKPWRETKASVFERWNLIGLCRWPRCGGKKKRRPTPEFVHIERNTHTRRHLQNFKTKLFFSV